MRVALAQVDCTLGDVAANLERAREAIAAARDGGADLVVFPELSLSGYALGALGDDVAMAADDPAIVALAAAAGEMAVVAGFAEQGPVHTYNSAIYLQAGRAVHVQRKLYLPTYGRFDERKHVSPGQSLRAFDTDLGRFAITICNDFWQPPLPYLAVQDGARMVIVPVCSSQPPAGGDGPTIQEDWRALAQFHARFLQTYVMVVNRVGQEAGLTFWGGSQVVDPRGRVIAEAPVDEPALLFADLDLAEVRRARHEVPLLKEARLGLLRRELERLVDEGGDL